MHFRHERDVDRTGVAGASDSETECGNPHVPIPFWELSEIVIRLATLFRSSISFRLFLSPHVFQCV